MTRTAKVWLIAAGALLLYCIIAWFIGSMLALEGRRLWLLRGGLWLLGAVAAGGTAWFLLRRAGQAPAKATQDDDIDATVNAARARLAQAHLPGTASLPLVLMMGADGSAKTTMIVQSGLEAELLAGELHRGDGLAPTNAVNVWYAQGTIFLEAGGPVLAEPSRWNRLLGYLHPRRLPAALGHGTVAPRVAVVCVSADELTRPGRGDALLALARTLRSRLAETSRQLGIRLPVYVLFTKADRIPFFEEYVRNLSREEAREVLGATLPVETGPSGLYADRQSRQLIDAFERLFLSLAGKRLQFLPREQQLERKLGAYEFPREFRKLAPGAVQFLVEICKPSELQVSPFLRGFYFTGVRPAAASGAAAVAASRPQRERAYVGATSVFNAERSAAPVVASPPPSRSAQRVPEWIFANRFFSDVLLGDQAAMRVTRGGARVNALRRLMLGAAAALCIVLALGFTVSYAGNRRLEREAADAVRAVQAVATPAEPEFASLDALRRLDSLRSHVAMLGAYGRSGAPLGLRWGLYQGDALYPGVRRAYFDGFQRLMFGATRASLLRALRGVPEVPRASSEYGDTYKLLKAHLITTEFPAHSERDFLTPVLRDRWLAARPLDSARVRLAERQLDFYGDELRRANPYPELADAPAVARARAALRQGGAKERIYQFMIAEASRDNVGLQFNRRYPGSAAVLVDAYEVPGAFTRGGWTVMQRSLRNPDRYFQGESWVVGEQGTPTLDRARIVQELRDQYAADYAKQWREYLRHASLVRYASVPDAAAKLATLSGPESPLLALFALAARNTAMDTVALARAFQPVQLVAPAGDSTKLLAPGNQPYMAALLQLRAALDGVTQAPAGGGDAAAGQALQSAQGARMAAQQVAQSFITVDPEARIGATVQRLMEDPITNVEGLLRHFGAGELNGAGRPFCAGVQALLAKYPFSASIASQASVAEVNAVFQPGTGALSTFYDRALQGVMVRQGSQFSPKLGGPVAVAPAFVTFLNRAGVITDALYKPGSAEPSLTFTVKPVLTDGIASVTLEIDGQSARFTKASPPHTYTWRATPASEARLSAQLGASDANLIGPFKGPWSIFRLFQTAERWTATVSTYVVEWEPKTGGQPMTLADGTPIRVAFEVNLGSAPLVLKPGFFAGLTCGGEIVR